MIQITKQTAKQFITEFIESKEAGTTTTFSAATMNKAAQQLFTAQGLTSPVQVFERNGAVVVINRDIYNNGNKKDE